MDGRSPRTSRRTIDAYRASLHDSLDDLSEQEGRFRLVPSKTTFLGLLKHVTYVEGVWFDQAVTGRSYAEIGIPATPDRSFSLTKSDTIASVQAAHRQRCELSGQTMAALSLNDVVEGRGHRLVWALQLQVLRELAQHAGHAESSGSTYSPDASTDPCASRAQAKRPPNAGGRGRGGCDLGRVSDTQAPRSVHLGAAGGPRRATLRTLVTPPGCGANAEPNRTTSG